MRRKSFDLLFETKEGMRLIAQERCMWRSFLYFLMSVGLFFGVITNKLCIEQTLAIRFALIIAVVTVSGVALSMYGFLLHGILETLGAAAGDAVGLICLLGYTTLPFLVLTPVALWGMQSGLSGIILILSAIFFAICWMLFLLLRSLQVIYLINFKRSLAVILFSILLVSIVFIFPIFVIAKLIALQFLY